jgi:hypothetical protein
MVTYADRGVYIAEYTVHEAKRLRDMLSHGVPQYGLEPPSGLFVTEATVEAYSPTSAYDPTELLVKSMVTGKLRKETTDTLAKLKAEGVNLLEVARTGAVYPQVPTKRFTNWRRQQYTLVQDTHGLWRMPWWDDSGRKALLRLFTTMKRKTAENIQTIVAKPELAIGDKEPGVGTGWEYPVNTRGGIERYIASWASHFVEATDEYYDGLMAGVLEWPQKDAKFRLRTTAYKGILAGVRSDGTVKKWDTPERQEIEAIAREVGNDPSSPFHNLKLNDRAWRESLRTSLAPARALPPYDLATHRLLLSTPNVTQVDDGEIGILSFDAGFTSDPSRFEKIGGKWHVSTPKERAKFGADNIWLAGLFTETHEGEILAHLKSGSPFTEISYTVGVGLALDWALKEIGSAAKFSNIGDDFHVLMKPEEVPALLAKIGPWMRMKSFTDEGNFIWGERLLWKGKDRCIAYVVPRILKTISSPHQREDLGTIKPNERRTMSVKPEAIAQADQYHKEYPEFVYSDASRDEWNAKLARRGNALATLVSLGHALWAQEFVDDKFATMD